MRRKKILAGIGALAALALAGYSTSINTNVNENKETLSAQEGGGQPLEEAVYPQMAQYPDESKYIDEKTGEWDDEGFSEAYDKWRSEKRALADLPEADGKVIEEFWRNSLSVFLTGSDGENKVYSPVNLYIALAMLTETTDGETRQQILDALGSEDMGSLRTQGENIWKLCYSDDGATTALLANSLWLRDDMEYEEDTLKSLADHYYTSSYSGVMGDPEYDKMLQEWLNEQTGGLLKEQAAGIKMSPETVMALASTIYYRAKWQNEFQEEDTKEAVFYGDDGEITCDFMNSSNFTNYYWSENFSAVSLSLNESGQMWLLLPDEGVSLDQFLEDEEAFRLLTAGDSWENSRYLKVNLSMPKFDVVSDINLIEGLKKMGIEDVFQEGKADFSPLTKEVEDIWLSQARHAARVKVDEKGVEAAAYTVMMADGSAMPPEEEVDFVLDRPFFFVITSRTGLPLFAGVVNHPV